MEELRLAVMEFFVKVVNHVPSEELIEKWIRYLEEEGIKDCEGATYRLLSVFSLLSAYLSDPEEYAPESYDFVQEIEEDPLLHFFLSQVPTELVDSVKKLKRFKEIVYEEEEKGSDFETTLKRIFEELGGERGLGVLR